MTLPAPITRLTSFTAFQQAQGDDTFPGTMLDADLDQTNNAIDALIAAVKAILRADGVLANGSVPRSALAADVMLGLGASRPWSSTVTYAVNATVTRGYGLYVALLASTGADPATDTVAWVLQADLSQAVVVADGSITTSKIPNLAVTEPKLAAGAASNRVIAAGAVTRDKAAVNLGILPVGAETDYAGITLPAGFLWCAGQAVSRSTYADLFNALTLPFTGAGTTGSNNLTGAPVGAASLGLLGGAIEGPGIPAGTVVTLIVNDIVQLSNTVTATSASGAFRFMPWGRGDGSTTFNVPDRRGRVSAGRDDMGGTAAGRLVQPIAGQNLSSAGGLTQITLVNANLPAVLPNGSVSVSYPSYSFDDVTYQGLTAIQSGSGSNFLNIWQATTAVTRTANPPAPTTFTVSNTNAGGGQAFGVLQPTGISNTIIFAGV